MDYCEGFFHPFVGENDILRVLHLVGCLKEGEH